MTASRTRSTGLAALLAAALLVPAAAAHAAGPETLILHQDPFDVAFDDLGGDGVGPGDLYTWTAPVTAEDGRTGTIVGDHQVVDMPTEGAYAEVRIGTSVIDLGSGDTIALGGLVPVTTPLGEMEPGTEFVNAIIGGTGAFGGAKGEIRSVRDEDGSWTHTIAYENAGPVDPERALRYSGPPPTGAIADVTGDGTPGTGDFRTFHWSGATDDGLPFDARGAQTVIRGPGDDGSLAISMGYSLEDIGGDILVGVTAQTVTDKGQIASTIAAALVGGTGRFAGARGSWTVERREDGSIVKTIAPLADPADTVERTLVLHSGVEAAGPLDALRQHLAALRPADRGEPGPSLGDQRTWALPFVGDDGEAGVAYGYLTVVEPPSDDHPVRTVAGLSVLAFDDGSTILVADVHDDGVLPNPADALIARPVLGGTGRYAGVSGELVTTFDPGDGFVHTLTLQGPAA